MLAVIETGSKQYIIEEGQIIDIERIEGGINDVVTFDTVLLTSDGKTSEVGQPYLNTSVSATILNHHRDKKIRVFHYKPKTGYKKTHGHRQNLSTVRIDKIGASEKAPS